MSRSVARMLGTALAVALALALAVGVWLTGRWEGTTPIDGIQSVWFASFLVFPVVGTLVVRSRPELAIGWVYLGIGVAQTTAWLGRLAAEHAWNTGSMETAAWAGLVANGAFGTAWVGATTFALLTFPADEVPVDFRRPMLWLSTFGYVVIMAGYALAAGPMPGEPAVPSPLAVSALGTVPSRIADVAVLAMLAITLAALVMLVRSWRRSRGVARARLMWLAFGAVVAGFVAAAGLLVSPWAPEWLGAVAEALVIAALPASTGVAILRTHLLDIAAVLDRTIVYAVLTGLVFAVYFVAVSAFSDLLGEQAGRGASLLASALVAVFLGPVKTWLDRLVERMLYGNRGEPYRVLAELAERLERSTALDDLLVTVTDTVQRTFRLPYVRVELDGSSNGPADAVVLPLKAHGREQGSLVIGKRRGQSAFDEQETRLLEDLARQVAREVHLARLATDLQDSRERLVRAREDERRRVRHDLHDGVGPTLAGAGLQVDALRERWQPEDPRAAAVLDKVKTAIGRSISDVRNVVDGLRPPALDDLGLVGVIREHADSITGAGLRIDVNCPDSLVLDSAAVEVAAYRIVTEALTNVVRHADANHCEVHIAVVDRWLRIDVADDGIGRGEAIDGVGLASMRERAAELGGTLTVGPRHPRGTTVSAKIPIGGGA